MLIVRRGLDPAYYFFTQITARTNRIAMIVDRRSYERRVRVEPTDIEERAHERRAKPPITWTRDGFLMFGR